MKIHTTPPQCSGKDGIFQRCLHQFMSPIPHASAVDGTCVPPHLKSNREFSYLLWMEGGDCDFCNSRWHSFHVTVALPLSLNISGDSWANIKSPVPLKLTCDRGYEKSLLRNTESYSSSQLIQSSHSRQQIQELGSHCDDISFSHCLMSDPKPELHIQPPIPDPQKLGKKIISIVLCYYLWGYWVPEPQKN